MLLFITFYSHCLLFYAFCCRLYCSKSLLHVNAQYFPLSYLPSLLSFCSSQFYFYPSHCCLFSFRVCLSLTALPSPQSSYLHCMKFAFCLCILPISLQCHFILLNRCKCVIISYKIINLIGTFWGCPCCIVFDEYALFLCTVLICFACVFLLQNVFCCFDDYSFLTIISLHSGLCLYLYLRKQSLYFVFFYWAIAFLVFAYLQIRLF